MQKTANFLLIGVLFLSTVFVGCKKGEEDPFLSLRSRKARLTGVWNLKSGNWTEIQIKANKDKFTHTYEYDGKFLKITFQIVYANGQTVANTTSDEYTEVLEIKKDDKFVYTQTWKDDDGDMTYLIYEGYWYFLEGIDDIEVKDKERVQLWITKYTEKFVQTNGTTTITEQFYEGSSNQFNLTFDLRRLSNKEIIIEIDEKSKRDGKEYINSGTKTYQQ